MPSPLLTRLAERPLLCDGAMGTLLYARGVALDACFDVLNLNEPKLVQSVHAEYIAAGCDAIETNTFGANRFKLASHGLQARVREINLRGAKLARDVRESMGRDVMVLGSIGPLGKYLAPLGSIESADARAAFHEQAEGLLEGGIDAFVIETFSDLTEMRLAVRPSAPSRPADPAEVRSHRRRGCSPGVCRGLRPRSPVAPTRGGANCSVVERALRILGHCAGAAPARANQPHADCRPGGERLMYLPRRSTGGLRGADDRARRPPGRAASARPSQHIPRCASARSAGAPSAPRAPILARRAR